MKTIYKFLYFFVNKRPKELESLDTILLKRGYIRNNEYFIKGFVICRITKGLFFIKHDIKTEIWQTTPAKHLTSILISLNYFERNNYETSGYNCTISYVRLLSLFEGVGINTPSAQSLNNVSQTLGTNVSKTVIGTTINMRATTVNTLFGSNVTLQATI